MNKETLLAHISRYSRYTIYSYTDGKYFNLTCSMITAFAFIPESDFLPAETLLALVTMQAALVCKRDTSAGFTCDRVLYFNQIVTTKNWIESSISYKQLVFDLESPFNVADFFNFYSKVSVFAKWQVLVLSYLVFY